MSGKEVTIEAIQDLANKGYTIPRISMKYDCTDKVIRRLVEDHPDLANQLRVNGKVRTRAQRNFGCYKLGGNHDPIEQESYHRTMGKHRKVP